MGGGGRRKALDFRKTAVSKNQGKLRLPRQQGAGKPQKPSLFCTSTRGNQQKSSLRERFEVC